MTVEKCFPESGETQKGHMRSVKAGIRSTKKETLQGTDKDAEDSDDTEDKPKQKELVIKHADLEEEFKKQISLDQTGRFPYRSFKGNQYVMIIHESDSNAILYQPVRNKEGGSNVKAWTEAMQ